MSEMSNYLSSSDGQLCDVDNCVIRTSLNFILLVGGFIAVAIGRRMMTVHVKFFKWLDTSICCTQGAATTPIVIAKFKRLEHAVENANEELKQAHALTNAALERERVER